MKESRQCPECGAELPQAAIEGLCPTCIARVTFGLLADTPEQSSETLKVDSTKSAPPSPAPVPAPANRPKIRYLGDYELLEELAHGGMGVIYKARQISLERTVALKMILSGHFASEEEVIRFYAEAQSAANLNHPNIVAIYEIGQFERQHYYSMQLVEGKSLAGRMTDYCLVPPAAKAGQEKSFASQRQTTIAQLLAKVARAVHFAHQRGIMHRDLKPANILIDAKGEPHVTDFGLAKRVDSGSDWSQSGDIVGTPWYMSPEQAAGKNKQLTTVTDVYSLGAILYHLLTGRPPFIGDSPVSILRQITDQEPKRCRDINPRANRDLETICLKSLEKAPEQRYGSAEALAEDLERWLHGEPITARPSTRWEQALKWSRRNPAITGVVCTLVLLGAIAFQGVSWKRWEDERIRRWEHTKVTGIPVGRTCNKVHFFLATIGTIKTKEGGRIGRYFINYADGERREIPLIFRKTAPPLVSPTDATNQNVITIWQSEASQSLEPARKLIKSIWPNPRPAIAIQTIDFEVLDGRAAPFLIAVTVE
jgi:serine/threonine-protein kinase